MKSKNSRVDDTELFKQGPYFPMID